MPGWLSRIDERSQRIETLSGSFEAQRSAYVVLDQRRAPERCAELVGQPGWHDYLTLFAGTPLSPLLEASPWLVELTPGSEAWQAIGSLCAGQRHGWLFLPAQATPLNELADHLRRLFILDDPHGGQSLVNLQDAAAWTALLAASSDTAYAQLIGPLGQVITPTPLTHWQRWQPAGDRDEAEAEAPALTEALERALKESPRAWWLSSATDTPLSALPPAWLERLERLEAAGIKQAHYLKRLLPLIRQADEHFDSSIEQGLRADLPTRKKVQALENLV
ncbi:DUF4123 domain-containing protein [Billgrantia aerodenitrificans]|uniref:DUF4123 domain-containing protein n=1 Tax=Billgrantia aerodenitrificans TaxID=2733483 RepID=A0ABS9AVH6_9GAMM|nr:DUF4123 domain-containing protein [Halomonas aerodenitrificans]MCE8025480.1 DUF4123 domain-containing protein [Halomonas aerodenitrificans]